jgi:hypothetical protein
LKLLILCLLLTSWSFAAAQEQAVDAPEIPNRMSECEGDGNATCSVWTFTGAEGLGRWSNGASANLTVQQFDPGWVIIRRTDPSGTSAGLTGVYIGKLHGNRVEGTVTWRWPGHWNKEVQGTWYATFGEPGPTGSAPGPQERTPQIGQGAQPQVSQGTGKDEERTVPPNIPRVMHWCSLHCTTLIWDHGHYTDASAPGNAVWEIESFTPESVILHRTDYKPYPGTAVISGKISGQGNTIVNGTITWTYHPCCGLSSGTFNAAWGAALGTVPGSDQERDRGQQLPEQTGVCASKRIRFAMQIVETKAIDDPNGRALSLLMRAFTGLDAQNGSVLIIDSANGTDGGRYTSKDPGSFICRGLFIRGPVHLEADQEADGAADLTAAAMKALLATHPTFTEWFKVKPLQNGHYMLTLLPSSIQLSQEYTQEFTYSPQ